MKIIKQTDMKIIKQTALFLVLILTLNACAQDSKKTKIIKQNPQKEVKLAMEKDSLDARVLRDVKKEQVVRKIEITKEALETIKETQSLLDAVVQGKKENAIKKGKKLIGDLEVLLTKDPALALIPVNVTFQKEEFVADIDVVKNVTKLAEKAMKKKYYREASDLLKDLRSEMVINTYLIPTKTYPEAIKVATALLEDNKIEDAKIVLQNVLSTIVIEKSILPLPILNAEQMIIEAAVIDAKDHENTGDVLNLLKNADYQLQLAEELGYGKKDKEYTVLYKSIKELQKSVRQKSDSKGKFNKLKEKLKTFQTRLFSKRK